MRPAPNHRLAFSPNGLFGPTHDLDADRAAAIGELLSGAIGGAVDLGGLLAETAADATAVIVDWLSTAPGPDGKPLTEAEIEPLRAAGFDEWLPPRPDCPAAVLDALNALRAVRGFLKASDERDTARALPLLFIAGQFHERMKFRRLEPSAREGQRAAAGRAKSQRARAEKAAVRQAEAQAFHDGLLREGFSTGEAIERTAEKFGVNRRTIQRDQEPSDDGSVP